MNALRVVACSYAKARSGSKKVTHHTRSFPCPPRLPLAPAALGAGGMLVLCDVAEELLVLAAERADDDSGVDDGADIEGFVDARDDIRDASDEAALEIGTMGVDAAELAEAGTEALGGDERVIDGMSVGAGMFDGRPRPGV